jgi:tetratricopeptide (TPR) repeat protein
MAPPAKSPASADDHVVDRADPTPTPAPAQAAGDDGLVPGWLALLVLILIVAVVGVAGFVVRGLIVGDSEKTPAQADIDRWSREVDSDPTDTGARLNLAYAYQSAQEYDKALEEYDSVLAAQPKQMAALYNKGVIYMTLGQGKKGE